MSDYNPQIERIRVARTIEDIQKVAREFSARASAEGGILYSRPVGEISSEIIAKELSAKTGDPIINDTARGRFLADPEVELAIKDSAKRIFRTSGQSVATAESSAISLLYGDAKVAATSQTSLQNSLWGEASRDFARSLRGDVKVVASNANIERVFGKVELPEVLANPNVRTLGGQPVESLKVTYAQGGADAVLPRVQAQFVEAVPKGVFVSAESAGAAAVSKVTVSREFAAAMEVSPTQLGKFASNAEIASSGLARAQTGILPAASEAALGAEAAAVRGLSPGAAKFVKGAGAAGVVLMAYDFAATGHRVVQLRAEGNETGAESARTHWIGRNAGGVLGGFIAGTGYGALAGSETGPGAIFTALGGGIIGAYLGDRWAEQKDNDRIYLQKDGDGNEWRRDPNDAQGKWMRSADTQRIDVIPTEQAGRGAVDVQVTPAAPTGYFGSGTTQEQRYVAGGGLETRLNYQAAKASYELGLANLPEPQNPFRLPPGAGDRHSLGSSGNDWTRDSTTGSWSREIVLGYLEHGMKHSIGETATPERAAQLEAQSRLVIAQNAANTPASIAARYQIAHDQFGWQQWGAVPDAVASAAARPGTMLASDGHLYSRDGSGQWSTPGTLYGTNQATGNVRIELDATYASQVAGLAQMNEIADYARRNPPPARDGLREMVADLYKGAGVARSDIELDAATAAVRSSHRRDGVDSAYSLQLLADPATGRRGAGSAIATFADDGKGDMVVKSVTQADAMQPARAAPETRDPTAMIPAAPTRISDGVRQALPGIGDRDANTLAVALDRQRIDDGLREINHVARNPAGTLLFGVQDQALRTAAVDVGATLALSAETVRAQWQATASASALAPPTQLPEEAKVRAV